MTAGQQMMFARDSGQAVSLAAMGNSYTGSRGASGGVASCTVSFLANGTVTVAAGATLSGSPSSFNWYTPTATGVGSGYWIRFTETYIDGGGTFSNNCPTWTQLSQTRTYQIFSDIGTDNTNYSCLIEISSSSSGSPVLASKTVSMFAIKS